MEKSTDQRIIKIQTVCVFVMMFLVMMIGVGLLNYNQEKKEKMKAAYTAELTVNRIESQLNKYLSDSDLLKRIVESGNEMDDTEFSELSRLMLQDNPVIEAFEMAKGGTVSQVYPMAGNEEAVGLDMLEHPDRKKEAWLARESGEYTIAGPYGLVQGGTGALLFDPVYTSDDDGQKAFWGFSLIVINWEKFIDEVELNTLSDAGYGYRIWKENMTTGDKITIAESESIYTANPLEVSCDVPNDTWYVEIAPYGGWISVSQRLFGFICAVIVAFVTAVCYWQSVMRRYKERVHAMQMEASANEARQANEAKTRFLFNMSHDMRTPMNAVIGFSNLLEKNLDDKERSMSYVKKIQAASGFLLSLMNYVLEMARIESGKTVLKLEQADARELTDSLDAVFEPTIQKKHLQYVCHMDVQHEKVICDQAKVREIFLNIISNSIKYTPEGGKISLDIREQVSVRPDQAIYKIVVQDNGIGISEDYLPHIFEEFTRERSSTESKVAGIGLGLPIVKSLVELMGGTIEVESQVGEGTRTTIILPFAIEPQAEVPETRDVMQKELIRNFKGRHVLLAEDNDLNAEIAMALLQETGFEVDWAEDGMACVEILQKKPEHYYDVILMDIQMPKMDGYEATETIRSLGSVRSEVPIVALTANAFEEDRKKAFDVGMNGYIPKPISMEQMFTTLRRVLV